MSDALPEPPDVVATLVANHREVLAFVERRVGDRAVAEEILPYRFRRNLAQPAELETERDLRADRRREPARRIEVFAKSYPD